MVLVERVFTSFSFDDDQFLSRIVRLIVGGLLFCSIRFAFANGVVRSFDVIISVVVDATADLYEEFNIRGIQKGADWEISYDSVGDDSLVSFDITAAGQVTYSKTTTTGWVSTTMKFRADTVGV